MFCSKCGEESVENVKFCKNCGESLFSEDITHTESGVVPEIHTQTTKKKPLKLIFTGIIIFLAMISIVTKLDIFSNAGDVVFCEDVSDNLDPIGQGMHFTPGILYTRLELPSEIGNSALTMLIIEINGKQESIYDSEDISVNPSWNIFANPYYFYDEGSYRVEFYSGGELIGNASVRIGY